MDFILGMLCGALVMGVVAAGVITWLPLPETADSPLLAVPPEPGRPWQETRNFLYYDGTEMPPIKDVKENENEQ
ncbi:MAG: hypothetical protein IKU51_05895 [Clostridia bacterium]|nr:hypothetical protein [Clostridia bacterium]